MKDSDPPKNPPPNLSAVAAEKWREILPSLPDSSPAALALLAVFCTALENLELAKTDAGKLRWTRAVRQLSAELRISPRARVTSTRLELRKPNLRLIARHVKEHTA